MKAKLTFNLEDPEQIAEHLRCVKALDFVIMLNDIKNHLRRHYKYDVPADDVLKDIQEELSEINIDEYLN
jgi:hypothetical protein